MSQLDQQQNNRHIVILTGATFQGSGMNFYILNNAIQWKKMGYRVTVICQDRNADKMDAVDSYFIGKFPVDAPKLQNGKMRVVIPDINNLIPIYATYQFCQFPGVTSKAVQQMTEEQIEMNIRMTVQCLRAVCTHDRPFKVIANYMILSGIIAAEGLAGFNIPYDIIVPGPALMYSVYPYPHLWKWVLPGFKKSSTIFQHTQFVKTQFLKCFKSKIQEYKLKEKVKAISPGMDPNKFQIAEITKELQQDFLTRIKQKMLVMKSCLKSQRIQISKKMTPNQIHQLFTKKTKSQQGNGFQEDLLEKWANFEENDEVILYVGALIDNKGMGELLAIAPKLISQRPTLKFVFCGSGPYREHMHQLLFAYQDGDFQRAKLISQAGQFITQINIEDHFIEAGKKITDRIIFAGLLEPQLVHKIYPFGKLLVSPSKMQESCSMGIIQAMCCGVTPVCNDHSWFSQVLGKIQIDYPELYEVIRIERSEFFDRLPDTIIKILDFIKNNGLKKLEYRQKIRQIAVKNFSWRHTATVLAQCREYKDEP